MSNDSIPTNLEILRMAREIVHNEYIDAKAQLHNKWLADSDALWRTSRVRLVYPPFPPYPTEDVIVARAKVLKNFLISNQESEEPTQQQEVNLEPKQQPVTVTAFSSETITQDPVDALVNKTVTVYTTDIKELHGDELEEAVNKNLEEYTKTVAARRSDEEATSTRILPTLMKRIDEIKKSWA